MAEMSIDLYVDESYLLALINEEPIPISDEKFAVELQIQEALFNTFTSQSLCSKPEEEKQNNKQESRLSELGESSSTTPQESLFNCSSFPSLCSKPEEEKQINNQENRMLEFGESSNNKLQINNQENRMLELGESSNNKLQEALFNSSSVQLLRSTPEKGALELWESSDDKLVFCGICMESKQNPEIFEGLRECKHSFCIDCIVKYIASKMKEKSIPIECPNPNCNRVIEPEYCGSILPKDVFERWESALFEASVLGVQKFYCPFKDCSVLMVDDGGDEVTQSECPYCHRLFCARCRVGWHVGFTCQEFRTLEKDESDKEDILFMKLAKDKQWRRCSKCKFYVEKTEGCLHMELSAYFRNSVAIV
ncbi:hypothetical protein Cgig2_031140 [Carnegiea gigantea]|uniref:RBR-type E3 ubiquitin transferase n=1 Tax=Carnegiea gigantea TaxID=171969 RepID=A0A9Q1KRU6_9CARY|nr:hypothetical protein Cgig2_031140 [Carnegiea gigantea]